MNVAALLHDSPSDDHRKRQENKEKEREKGQSSQSSAPPQTSQQQQQQPAAGNGYRSYSPLGGPGQQSQRPPVSPTNTYDARLREREMRERGVGREREHDHPPYHPPTRPYSHSHSHAHPPPMNASLPPPPIPGGAAHSSHPQVPRHQAFSHSSPTMHPSTGTPPFLSPLNTPRDPGSLPPPPGSAVPSAALPAPGPNMAPAPEHLAAYGTQHDRDKEGVHRRRAARSISSATAPIYRDGPPLAMHPRSPDAGYRTGSGERTPSMAGAHATRSPVQPGPGFSVVPPPAQSPHQLRATPPGPGMASMPPPPPSSSNSSRRGHMHSPAGHPHGGVPGASSLSSPAMDSLRPHENEHSGSHSRRSGPPTPGITGPPTPVATTMSASAAGALQPLAMRNDRDRDQRFERYPGEDPHQQPQHQTHPHQIQLQPQQQQQHHAPQQRRMSRSSSMSGGMGPGAGGLGPHSHLMSTGGAGSPEVGGRSRDESRERRGERGREGDQREMERARERERAMGGPHHSHQQQQPPQQPHRLHHVQHPHHNYHPDHVMQNLQYRERGLPPEKEREPQVLLVDTPSAARANTSRQGRRGEDVRGGGRGREPLSGIPPDTARSGNGGGGVLKLAPPGVTVTKDPPLQPGPPPVSAPLPLLPAPPDSRPTLLPQASLPQSQQQPYSSSTLQLGPAGGGYPPTSNPHSIPYGYAPPPSSSTSHPHGEIVEQERKHRHMDKEYERAGGPGMPPSSGIPPARGATPGSLAGPGAGVHSDAYGQVSLHPGPRDRERDRDRDSHPHLQQYHPFRRAGSPPPPIPTRGSAAGRHVPQPLPPGQDVPAHRLERAPPSHATHSLYPPNMVPLSSTPGVHPHQQPGLSYPSHPHPRHGPSTGASSIGLFPPPGVHGHSPMGPGMEPAPLTIQLLPPHMTLPIAPLTPPAEFDTLPLDPPLNVGTFVYPRLPFPYTFPTVLAASNSGPQEVNKNKRRELGDEMGEGNPSTQSARAGSSRRERETHVTILIPNASLPTPPSSPVSPNSPASSSSVPTPAIRKPPTPRIWGGGLPTDLYSHAYFTRVYGAQQPVNLSSSSSRGPGGSAPGRREQHEPQLRRMYTDDSDVRLCALHAGCISWTGLRRAKRRGMDLRVQLALGRDMGKYVGGLPSAAVVGGGPIGEPVDVGLSGEEDGVEEGEVEVVEERERHAMMECLRSADWMSGHDGCAFEVLGAEWVPRGTARSLGLRNRTQRLKEYGEQRAAIMQDEGSNIGKRKRKMEIPPYPAAVTLPDAEKLLSRERTIIFGAWDRKGRESIGYKYDSETFKGVLFGSSPADASRSSVLNPVNEPHTTAVRGGSKRRKLNGTAPARVERQGDVDADVDMDAAKAVDEGVHAPMKSIVLENEREKFLLVALPSPGPPTPDTTKERGKEDEDKENLPHPHPTSEKGAGGGRRFKLCILDSKKDAAALEEAISSETRVLRASFGAEDVRFVEGGLAVSLAGDTPHVEQGEGEEDKGGGLFIRVERWRWATGKEVEV